MLSYAAAMLVALGLWWASTGVILYLNGLPSRTFRISLAVASVLSAVALWGAWAVRDEVSATGAYIGFICGLTLWGWQTMTFYMGYITGPRTGPCPPGLGAWQRFIVATETTITHELVIVIGAVVLFAMLQGSANQVALSTYLVLWWMHLSGKLNVHFGVPNLSEEFLPDRMRYLETYMRRAPMNLLFPVSVTLSTLITAHYAVSAADAPAGSFAAVADTLLASLMALAILEHWLLVLPLPAMALWQWSLSSRNAHAAPGSDVGFSAPLGMEGRE